MKQIDFEHWLGVLRHNFPKHPILNGLVSQRKR